MNPFNKKQRTTQTNTLDLMKSKMQVEILKEKLTNTDYQIIKCYEYALAGRELPYDAEKLHKNRQTIRDKINELQGGVDI